MTNYVYKLKIEDKTVNAVFEEYFSSLKKVLNSRFSSLIKPTGEAKKRVVIDRVKECRGETGIIFEFNSTFSHVTLRKIKPL